MTMPPSEVSVEAERSGKWWALSADEIPGAVSQVEDITDAPAAMRGAIALLCGVHENDVDVRIHVCEDDLQLALSQCSEASSLMRLHVAD